MTNPNPVKGLPYRLISDKALAEKVGYLGAITLRVRPLTNHVRLYLGKQPFSNIRAYYYGEADRDLAVKLGLPYLREVK